MLASRHLSPKLADELRAQVGLQIGSAATGVRNGALLAPITDRVSVD